jgi:PAS domain S-box-containing protein
MKQGGAAPAVTALWNGLTRAVAVRFPRRELSTQLERIRAVSPLSSFGVVDEPVERPSSLTPQLHFRALVEAFAEGVYVVNTSGICVYANPAVGEMLGHDVEALIGTDIHSVLHHSHADGAPFPRAECPLYRSASSGVPCEVTDEVLWRADGTPLPVEYRIRPLLADGHLAGGVVTFTDATERRTRVAELVGIVDTAGDAFLRIDDNGEITGWNQAATTMLGWTAQEMLGRYVVTALVPVRCRGEYAHRLRGLREAPESGFPRGPVELLARHKDGRELSVELMIGRMRRGERSTFHAFLRDVTERQATARSLERSETLHRLLTEQSSDLISRHAPDGEFLYVSPASSDLLGLRPEELLGRRVQDLVHPDDVGKVDGVSAETLSDHERAEVTLRLRHRDGHWVWVESVLSALCSEDGMVQIQVQTRDITDRHVREAEIEQTFRLDALGRLSAGLAHEINTPIQFVSDNTRFLAEACQDLLRTVLMYRGLLRTPEPLPLVERQARARAAEEENEIDYLETEIPGAIAQTLDGIDRVATIVRAMRAFSHPGQVEQTDADLNDALTAAVTVTRHEVSSVADVRLQLADLPPVRCNVTDLNQAFLNLIVNAADAIEETGQRGTISVVTSVDDEHVTVSISDTGTGMAEDVLPKIFDPFFTTKEVGKGTGQGLALVRAIVQEGHGGTVAATSRLGSGSTFTIRLPIAGMPQPS